MLEETNDREEIIERVAALDIGKAEVVCCVRVPGAKGKSRRVQEVTTYQTMTRALLGMVDRLTELEVTRVVMEATSDYWKPPFYLLEAAGFETWLVNAKDVKHLPGRPKTDTLDAVWLCKLAERQTLRPSFVPPPDPGATRSHPLPGGPDRGAHRGEAAGRETARGRAQIKLSVVAADIFGVSGREMMAELIAGQRNPRVLAQFAPGRMRAKLSELEEAFTGRFNDHHGFLLSKMLARIDQVDADLADLDDAIEAEIAPFAEEATRLDDIPGIGQHAACVILSEIGTDMSQFPTAAHLCPVRARGQGIRRTAKGQREDRARQSLPGPGPR